jgi:Asp-tRNA(Asn)/Glu-tRNA(Gln) amidotransferase A subunit family amidase
VPAAFCGVFGLKPTYGLLSRAGMMLLAPSLDHAGPLAGSAVDLAAAYEALRKWDDEDPEVRTPAVRLNGTIGDLRIGVVSEEFGAAIPEAWSAVEVIARALSVNRRVRIPEVDRARAAASLITASEAAAGHLPALRFRAKDFDPLIRDRLLAAALLPATTYLQAQRFRAWFRSQLLAIFRDIDILITPTTPCFPPLLGAAGVDTTTKLSIGRFTQPFSLVGLPAISVPVKSATTLPLGVQLISAPFHKDGLLQLAAHLETTGVVSRWPLPPDIM